MSSSFVLWVFFVLMSVKEEKEVMGREDVELGGKDKA